MSAQTDRLAGVILEEIHDMQVNGLYHGIAYQGLLPKVASFSELHAFFDANVGWSIDDELEAMLDAGDLHSINAVFDAVDSALAAEYEEQCHAR